jgi:hypothetical protein
MPQYLPGLDVVMMVLQKSCKKATKHCVLSQNEIPSLSSSESKDEKFSKNKKLVQKSSKVTQ